MRGPPIAVLRYAITLAATAAVAWGLWRCQGPGWQVPENVPFFYPPSQTYTETTKHGWPAMWLVRRATSDLLGRTTPNIAYTTLFSEFVCDLVAWVSILTCTAHTMWRATGRPAQPGLWTLFWAHVAVAVVLCWWRVECEHTYVANHPELTAILRDAPTTPLLRLLKFPASVSMLVLFGVFCVLLQVNTCLTGLLPLRPQHANEVRRSEQNRPAEC
jgi:hypothetical protein